MDSFVEAAEELYGIPLEKAAKKIDRFSSRIDLLGKRLSNATKAAQRNRLIDRQTGQETKSLEAYKEAARETRAMLEAAGGALSKPGSLDADDGITGKEKKAVISAVRSGKEADLSYFSMGSEGYKAAIRYNEALKAHRTAADDAAAAQQDYDRWLVESAKQKFDNIAGSHGRKVQKIGWEMSGLDSKVSEAEARGMNVDISYYKSQKKANNKTLKEYKAELKDLRKYIGGIKEGTDEWYDAKDEIQQVEDAISGCVEETYRLNNEISQLHFGLFGDVSDSIGRIITEQEFIRGLFAHEKNVDTETGGFTDAGLANLGSLSASYYASKEDSDRDKELLDSLNKVKSKGKQKDGTYKLGEWEFNSLDDLQAKIDEVYTKWQEDIRETYSLESDIAGLMKEKYQAELDMLQELIDAKKEALQSEKDLHDYQKTLNEKTEGISTIRKQMAAYSGNTSEEGLAKLQRLQKELSEKEEGLRETEYGRYISDQQDMLDKLYEEYEGLMSKKLEDFMGLVREGLQTSNGNTAAIREFLNRVIKDNGYKRETTGIFKDSWDIAQNVGNAVAKKEGILEGLSGTEGNAGGKAGSPIKKQQDMADGKKEALDFIRKHARKAGGKKSDYSDVNKAIYENKAKAYKGKGKVLSGKDLETLARKLMVEHDGDSTSKGALYRKLKSLKVPGFRKGGIARLIKENGEDGITLARNGEGFIAPEHVKPIEELVSSVPDINRLAESLLSTPPSMDAITRIQNPLEHLKTLSGSRGMGNVVNIGTVSLPNVTNYHEFKEQMLHDVQTEKKTEMLFRDVSGMAQITDGGRLGKLRHRF